MGTHFNVNKNSNYNCIQIYLIRYKNIFVRYTTCIIIIIIITFCTYVRTGKECRTTWRVVQHNARSQVAEHIVRSRRDILADISVFFLPSSTLVVCTHLYVYSVDIPVWREPIFTMKWRNFLRYRDTQYIILLLSAVKILFDFFSLINRNAMLFIYIFVYVFECVQRWLCRFCK